MSTTLIVPGYKGSDAGHWQHYWLKTDPHAVLVAQDDWFEPCLDSWMQRLLDYVHRCPGAQLVAHSLGVPLVAHLARVHPDIAISRALLVAPADVDTRVRDHDCFATFVPAPLERLPFPSTVVASRNDPYIAFERSVALAAAWGARFVDLGLAGHINAESGYGPWPEARFFLPADKRSMSA